MKNFFLSWVTTKIRLLAMLMICTGIMFLVMWLNNYDLYEIAYAFLLCLCVITIFAVFDFIRYKNRHKYLDIIKNKITISIEELPKPYNAIEADYNELITIVNKDKNEQVLRADKSYRDLVDYYTIWVHQIKTPISAMRLLLQSKPSDENAELELELLRIEQYVDMVLNYLRLDSDTTDFVLHNYDIDKIIKQSVRKNAKLFIRKKITLNYEDLGFTVLTDEKWLGFVIEQILSNALKYTKDGSISIYAEDKKNLVIEDTGIGIAPEDLPRVFDNSFTGYNGRHDKKATGIGLYLCKKILKKLGHTIKITSTPGVGTKVVIGLSSYSFVPND